MNADLIALATAVVQLLAAVFTLLATARAVKTANAAEHELGGGSTGQEGDAQGSRRKRRGPTFPPNYPSPTERNRPMTLVILALAILNLTAAIALYRRSK